MASKALHMAFPIVTTPIHCKIKAYADVVNFSRGVGGFLGATGDYYLGARIAVVGSLISVLITYFIPHASGIEVDKKDSSDDMARDEAADQSMLLSESDSSSIDGPIPSFEHKPDSENKGRFYNTASSVSPSFIQSLANQIHSIAGVVAIAWLLLSVKIISSVANAMMSETFPLVLKNTFKLNEQYLGLTIAANSGFNGLVNGLLLAPMVAFSGGDLVRVIYLCLYSMATIAVTLAAVFTPTITDFIFSFSASSMNTSLFIYLSFIFLLSIFQYALSTTITGQSTSMVNKTQKGTLLGVEHSFFALARVVAPQCGVTLLQRGGISAVAAVSAAIYGATSLLWCIFQSTLNGPYRSNCKVTKSRKSSDDKF